MLLAKVTLVCFLISLGSANIQSRARQMFACDDMLNSQIALEFEAAQTYLSLSMHFSMDRVALKGLAKLFRFDWKEELEHGEKLIDYGITRGAKLVTPSVMKFEASKWCTLNVCEILEQVLALEKKINENLHELVKCGDSSKDVQLSDMITSGFINDQFRTNKFLADLLTKIERSTLTLSQNGTRTSTCDGLGLELIDRELLNGDF